MDLENDSVVVVKRDISSVISGGTIVDNHREHATNVGLVVYTITAQMMVREADEIRREDWPTRDANKLLPINSGWRNQLWSLVDTRSFRRSLCLPRLAIVERQWLALC